MYIYIYGLFAVIQGLGLGLGPCQKALDRGFRAAAYVVFGDEGLGCGRLIFTN